MSLAEEHYSYINQAKPKISIAGRIIAVCPLVVLLPGSLIPRCLRADEIRTVAEISGLD